MVYQYPTPVKKLIEEVGHSKDRISGVEDIRGALLLSFLRFDGTGNNMGSTANDVAFQTDLNEMAEALFDSSRLVSPVRRRSSSFCSS